MGSNEKREKAVDHDIAVQESVRGDSPVNECEWCNQPAVIVILQKDKFFTTKFNVCEEHKEHITTVFAKEAEILGLPFSIEEVKNQDEATPQ